MYRSGPRPPHPPAAVQLVVAVAIVVACELAIRVAVSSIHPYAIAVTPPIVAIPGLGIALFVSRRAVDGAPPTAESIAATIRASGPSLLLFVIVGHVLAVVGGFASFLLVDTPIRYAIYWLGWGSTITLEVVLVAPLLGVAVGAAVVWAVLVPGVDRIDHGTGVGEALRFALVTAIRDVRSTAMLAAAHLLLAGITALSVLGAVLLDPWSLQGSLLAMVCIGFVPIGSLSLLVALHADRSIDRSDTGTGIDRATWVRVAIVLVLVVGLVATAGAVRGSELRPMDEDRVAIPDDPGAAYTVALSNTDRTSHELHVTDERSGDEWSLAHDRGQRRIRWNYSSSILQPNTTYYDAGIEHPGILGSERFALGLPIVLTDGWGTYRTAIAPGYWHYEPYETLVGPLRLPDVADGEWSELERDGDDVLLGLEDDDVLFEGVTRTVADERVTIEDAGMEVWIDTERGVITDAEWWLNASVDESPIEAHYTAVVETGVTVERPATLGGPRVGELLWRVLAY